MLDDYRSAGERLLAPLADRLAKGGADRLTWASLVCAGAAGVCYTRASPEAPLLLVMGALFVLGNGVLDALDGMVARRNGTAGKAGDFLDHALDRYADLFIIGGLAASAFGGFTWGFYAVTGVFLTSYMGTQAAAVGLKRDYKGVLGRADRLILLTFVPILSAVLVFVGIPSPFQLPGGLGAYGLPTSITLIQGLLGAFALLGHATAVQRFRRARAALASP